MVLPIPGGLPVPGGVTAGGELFSCPVCQKSFGFQRMLNRHLKCHSEVKRQENLLQRCKEMIRSHKERCAQLTNEKEALQEQLEERLQELEKMKVK